MLEVLTIIQPINPLHRENPPLSIVRDDRVKAIQHLYVLLRIITYYYVSTQKSFILTR